MLEATNRKISWKLLSLLSLSLSLVGAVVLGLLVSAFIASPVAAGPSAQGQYPVTTITVSGFGEAAGAPDIAYLQLGLDTRNEDLGAAVAEAETGMTAIVAAIRDLGIAPEDIQTLSFNVWSDEGFPGPDGQPTGQRVYRVNNILRITVRDTGAVGAVIDAAIAAGANNIQGLNFGMDDPAALEQQARLEAIADARERAGQLAEAIGATLGDPIMVSEGVSGGLYPPMPYGVQAAVGLGGGGIAEGQLTVSVQVQVTFAIIR